MRALLASAAVAVAVGILLFFAWRISRMENEIHDLILRDEATRLYNVRGFHMLAEHALRLAQRSGVPFSVLYIDIENLAEIHAQLGPNATAAALAEAGEILRATFRESDIKGRIGADQFAVAGQFDRAGISVAALRLEAATAARGAKSREADPTAVQHGSRDNHRTRSAGEPARDAGARGPRQKPTGKSAERDAGELRRAFRTQFAQTVQAWGFGVRRTNFCASVSQFAKSHCARVLAVLLACRRRVREWSRGRRSSS